MTKDPRGPGSSQRKVTHSTGSGIDIWHNAGPPAHSSKRFISLHPGCRTVNRDRPPRAPDRRIGIVRSGHPNVTFKMTGDTTFRELQTCRYALAPC
jgi:hypothetical protein